ncbi:ECF-type sigma factor [Stieleria neptunia]|uniref:ECF-type sigma factor n=1 Tax=Stieleria neptunia TaxID=2527979 RepID=UPI001E45BE71|nr:ECF-type sigma factor [Stieleria neptunia]
MISDQLDDSVLQTVALLRLEGDSVDEIAQRLGCAKRSVERRLNLIRTIWQSDEQ